LTRLKTPRPSTTESAPPPGREPAPASATPTGGDPLLGRIVEALEQIRAAEFDFETLLAASDVLGEDAVSTWKPSLHYFPPERQGDEYHVTIYTQGACTTCPIQRLHVNTIQPRLREMVGYDRIFVHDFFAMELGEDE